MMESTGQQEAVSTEKDRKDVYRIATLILCILFTLISLQMLLSWRFDLILTLDAVIVSHSETVSISILDIVSYADEYELIAYSLLNVFVLFSILSVLSPRFALMPPFLFLLSGYFLSGDFSGDLRFYLEYSLDTSGAMEYAVSCFAVTMAIALLANISMRADPDRRFFGLMYNVREFRDRTHGPDRSDGCEQGYGIIPHPCLFNADFDTRQPKGWWSRICRIRLSHRSSRNLSRSC